MTWLVVGGGVVLAIVAALSALRMLPPNRFVGLRTDTTMRSAEAWYVAHRAAAPYILAASVATVAIGVRLSNNGRQADGVVGWLTALATVLVVVAGVGGTGRAKRFDREQRQY